MLEQAFRIAFVVTYISILLVIAIYGLHRYVLVYLYLKHKNRIYKPRGVFTKLPRITVQLPMYNEDIVAERVIRTTCQIDYPHELLEIQVLDDSTDEAAKAMAQRAAEECAAEGYPVRYIHRANREGYKAGALAAGLKQASGEFIAIFDADFLPPRDILRNVVDYFYDDSIGMVQVRWDHLNRNASLLTRGQAIFLDGHFVIEHTARNRSGRFMHFNGTAGVWRRKTIDDSGGWQHDTLTEDLDLSYRAQLRGWQFVYLPQVCAPAELPPEMIGFKQQAHRWTKGSMQTAIKLLPRILRSKHLPLRVKSEAFFHLTNTIIYPLMVLMTLMMYPAFIYVDGPLKHYALGHWLFSTTLFILATCSASTFFIFAQRELFGNLAGWKSVLFLPFLMALGIGISLNNAQAVIGAFISAKRRKPSEFIRTPKYGVTGRDRNAWQPSRVFSFTRLALPIVEMAFGAYMASFIFISMYYSFARGSIPFLFIFAGGYAYVGGSSLYVIWRMRREEANAAAAAGALVVVDDLDADALSM
jgi:cellulose synthase/poly-beta-1,6-N-acetylglucosamine synthase-like glycosyltransferase